MSIYHIDAARTPGHIPSLRPDLSVDSARHRRGRDCGRAPSGASVLESEMSEMLHGASGCEMGGGAGAGLQLNVTQG